jgi:hypothetical protein
MKGLGSLPLCAYAARLHDMELNNYDSLPALSGNLNIYQVLETRSSVSPR